MDVWNYILGYRNTLKSVFDIPFNGKLRASQVTLLELFWRVRGVFDWESSVEHF